MSRKRKSRSRKQAAPARKKAQQRRDALWNYLIIALLAGLVIYTIYSVAIHHP